MLAETMLETFGDKAGGYWINVQSGLSDKIAAKNAGKMPGFGKGIRIRGTVNEYVCQTSAVICDDEYGRAEALEHIFNSIKPNDKKRLVEILQGRSTMTEDGKRKMFHRLLKQISRA